MHAKASLRNLLLLSLLAAFIITFAGCTPKPPATAVLAGTWTLTESGISNPNLTQVLLNFDSNGNLISVTYVFQNATATKTLPDSSTAVNGTAVTIASTTAGFTLTFNGTLNADNTVITGTATFSLTIGNTTITAAAGAATLTKGTVITGNAANGQTFFNQTCVACHSAPSLVEASNEIVPDLGSLGSAMSGITLTAQEVADLQAYLATVTPPPAGNATNGQTFYAATCNGCHPTPSVLKPNADAIISNMGAVNAAMNGVARLTDVQIVDLQAYLATQ